MIRALIAAALLSASAPALAQTFAITGGTVALGDGSEPIPNGMVVIRDGRVVAAGDVRMKLPEGTQVIDATGKWVTPGIVAGFSRLGLADVDLSADGADDTTANGPFSAALDASTAINPLDTTVAVNRADGVTRALVAPQAGRSIFGGQGAVIDTGAEWTRSPQRAASSSSSLGRLARKKQVGRVHRRRCSSAMPCAKLRSFDAMRRRFPDRQARRRTSAIVR